MTIRFAQTQDICNIQKIETDQPEITFIKENHDENITFIDYLDDVYHIDNNGIFRTDEKPNVNIISGGYSKVKENVTLTLEVKGEIENRGDFNDIYNFSGDFVWYSFTLKTSNNTYTIDYVNKKCIFNRSLSDFKNISNFSIDGSIFSVSFALENHSETYEFLEIAAYDMNKSQFILYFSDFASDYFTSLDTKIIKPKKSLYMLNREIIPLHKTVIIGKIDIEVKAINTATMVFMTELYIDNEFKETGFEYCAWNDFSFGKHTIKIISYDFFCEKW